MDELGVDGVIADDPRSSLARLSTVKRAGFALLFVLGLGAAAGVSAGAATTGRPPPGPRPTRS